MDEVENILKSIQKQTIRNTHLRKIKADLIKEIQENLEENPVEIINNDPPSLPKNHVNFDKIYQNVYIHFKTQT